MENEISAIITLLGEQNVKSLKSEIKDIIVERVKSDLEDCDEYLLAPDDLQTLVNEVLQECKEEIKPIIKEKLYAKALSQINI